MKWNQYYDINSDELRKLSFARGELRASFPFHRGGVCLSWHSHGVPGVRVFPRFSWKKGPAVDHKFSSATLCFYVLTFNFYLGAWWHHRKAAAW